ncbi:MAG: HYR domain-containing protein, partial [Bacteroidota bacterium]
MNAPILSYRKIAYVVLLLFLPLSFLAQVEICDDGIDNDGDNLIDNFDLDCSCQNPNLAYYGSTNGGIYSVDVLVDGSEELITNSPFVTGNINSMASNADNILVYYGSGQTVYYWDPQLGTGAGSHQILADLSTFPNFNGNGLESSGGAYLDNVYYLAAEQDPTGGNIEDVYALQLNADGDAVLSVTPLNIVASALLDDPNFTADTLGGFGDIIAIVEVGDVVIYGTSGDNFWKFNTTTSDFIMINENPPNNPPWQLFSNSSGQIFGAFQGSGTIFELNLTDGSSLGTTHTVPQFITDATGPLNCPPPIEICGNGVDDDDDGLVDLADPDCCVTGALDSDNDGLIDCADGCPNDPDKIEPGICGCGNDEPGTTCDDGDPNTVQDEIQPDCNCLGYFHDLALTKTGATGNLVPGGNVSFTFNVFNQGNVDATDIIITDYIPAGLSLNDAAWSESGGVATLISGLSVNAGNSASVTISFNIENNFQGASITNVGEISSSSNPLGIDDIDSDEDSDPNNDTFIGNDIIDGTGGDDDNHDEEIANITQVFDLALIKNGATGNLVPGGNVTYTLTVFNQGTIDATNVVLVDYVPSGLTLNDANWSESGGIATLQTSIALVEPGQNASITISFDIDASFMGTSLTNIAEIFSADNALGLSDSSTPDNISNNDVFGGNDITDDSNGDEDDHDQEDTDICQDLVVCPGDITTNSDNGLCSAIVNFPQPIANGNCLGIVVSQSQGLSSGSAFPIGNTTIEFTLTDPEINVSTCSFTITVNDNEDPTITCPTDVTVDTEAGLCSASNVTLGTPTTADNCSVANVSNDAPATFPLGTTTVTWTVTDGSGNTASCTQDVTVEDNEDPTIS